MNLKITGHHVDVTDPLREYVLSKLHRISRHADHLIDVSVTLSVDKLDKRAEANVHLSGHDIHVQSHDADMYAAIDSLADKLDRQIIRHKESRETGRSEPSPKRTAP